MADKLLFCILDSVERDELRQLAQSTFNNRSLTVQDAALRQQIAEIVGKIVQNG